MALSVKIRSLTSADAERCDAIIASLPYHFGDPGGRAECARAVRAADGLVAAVDRGVAGFLTVERHFEASAEITWMAVHRDRRGRGIGHLLVERLVELLEGEGRMVLLVMTLSGMYDEGDVTDGYNRTRAFYRSVGFLPARELPDLWPNSPALMLVRPLTRS